MSDQQPRPDPLPDVAGGWRPPSVDTVDLAAAYAFPDGDAPWVRTNFVSSIDGAATVDGRSGGLANEADHRIFGLLRALADVVLVGAGTVRAEGYGPVEVAPEWAALRRDRSPAPPIAVVSHGLDLDLSKRLFASGSSHARPIVVTDESAPPDRCEAVREVADVIVAGRDLVDLPAALDALAARGLRRVTCEGGPDLHANLVAAGSVDELCLTRSPMMVAGHGLRILNGPTLDPPVTMRLAHVLADGSYLFERYVRDGA